MPVAKIQERRAAKRFTIQCPVSVKARGRGKRRLMMEGLLRDISVSGAQFGAPHPLEVGAPVALDVHFSHPDGNITTMRFEGTVARADVDPQYEVAVRFRNGRFLRDHLGEAYGLENLKDEEVDPRVIS